MSLESASEYLRRLATDPAFVDEVKAAKSAEARREVIAAAGYDFSLEELAEARSLELSDEESREPTLSSDELAEIVGGSGCGYTHEGEVRCLVISPCPIDGFECKEVCKRGPS